MIMIGLGSLYTYDAYKKTHPTTSSDFSDLGFTSTASSIVTPAVSIEEQACKQIIDSDKLHDIRSMVRVTSAFSVDGITVESAGGKLSTDYVSAFVDMTTPGTYIIELPATASTGVVTATITGTGGSCVVNLNYAISMYVI